jgi:hypothetical protein
VQHGGGRTSLEETTDTVSRRQLIARGGAATLVMAAAVVSRAAGAQEGTQVVQTTTDQNVAVVARFFELYAARDTESMREEVLAPDVTWLIPGHHPLAGLKRGVDEIMAYFDIITEAGFKAEPLVLAAADDWVIDVHRGFAETDVAAIDINWVLAYRIRDGRIAEVQNFAGDQHKADLFFWTVWGDRLKPVQERLVG